MSAWRWLFGRRPAESDLRREIEAHLAERVDDLIEGGMNDAEARTQARREFGNRTLQIEQSREVWIAPWLSSLRQDLHYAVRSFARQRGFTASVVGVLALGIAPVTALFTLFNASVLKPWPVRDPSSLAIVKPVPGPREQFGSLSNLEYRYFRDHTRAFTHLATWMSGGGPIAYGSTRVDFIQSKFVSANYFDTLGVGMRLGRTFLPEEEDYTSPRAVAIISERLWREQFGASPSIIGDTVRVYDRPFTVVGVARAGFFDVDSVRRDVWIPLPSNALIFVGSYLKVLADPRGGGGGVQQVVGRLSPGVSQAAARAELDVLGRQFRRANGIDAYGYTLLSTRPISHQAAQVVQGLPVFEVMSAALVLLMLLACANAGNLFLARGLSRQREIAIRISLGASRWRVTRQLLTEALLLSTMAGATGLAFAAVAMRMLALSQHSPMLANPDPYVPDLAVTAFALAMGFVGCLASAVMPALRSARVGIAMRANEAAAARSGAGRWRTALLATQIAVSMVLLVGANLLTRAVSHAFTIDPGFTIHDVQVLSIRLSDGTPPARQTALSRSLRVALTSADLPPIASSEFTAITSSQRQSSFRRSTDHGSTGIIMMSRDVSAEYFRVLGIPLIHGRTIVDDERADEVVVNESAARVFWPDEEALGKTLVSEAGDKARTYTVVGVAKDVPVTSLSQFQPVVYEPLRSAGLLLVRDLSPAIVERIATIARAIEPGARVTARPLSDDIRSATATLALAGRLAWAIGVFALILATAGAFGVFAYNVEERRREIGIRMALGARTGEVIALIVWSARRPLLFGLGAGVVMASIGAPVLRRFLYGLNPFDPVAYAGVFAILVGAALLATWIPARRAAHIDPAVTLRAD